MHPEKYLTQELSKRLGPHLPNMCIATVCAEMVNYYRKNGMKVDKVDIIDYYYNQARKTHSDKWVK